MKKFKTIMLIDDNDIDNYIHRKVVEELGLAEQILVFNNIIEAMVYLKNLSKESIDKEVVYPQLILLDMHMPLMTGLEFMDELKRLEHFNQKLTDIFILTCSDNLMDVMAIRKQKCCSAIIQKPLTEDKLLSVLA